MKASILASERNVVANTELGGLTVWRHLFQKLKEFFEEPFESDWEKKTGLDWREWNRFPHMQSNVILSLQSLQIGGMLMKNSILKGKTILAVNNEPDVLNVLEGKIKEAYPDCFFDKATTYKEAVERMASWTYDLVILDGMGVRGFDLLQDASVRSYPVVMLTDRPLGSEALRQSDELGVRAYLPKGKIGEIVPLLENELTYKYLPVWKRFYKKMKGLFGTESKSDWKKSMDTRAISIYQN